MELNIITKKENSKTSNRQLLNVCPECGSNELITDEESGELICGGCGLVLSNAEPDQTPEWRTYTPEEKAAKNRVGSPITLQKFDKGLSTTFQTRSDIHGKSLSVNDQFKMMRLRKWQSRVSRDTSKLRNLSQATTVLGTLTDSLSIPASIAENAAQIYRKALDKGLVRGRSIKSVAAASIYAACRLTRIPRNLTAIAEASGRDKKEVARCYRLLRGNLDIKMPTDDPVKYVAKISSKLELSQKTQNQAVKILEKAQRKNAVAGKAPCGIAASAIYIAYIMNPDEKKVTQQQLAEAAEVTEVTVRNRYKELSRNIELDYIADL